MRPEYCGDEDKAAESERTILSMSLRNTETKGTLGNLALSIRCGTAVRLEKEIDDVSGGTVKT